MFLDKTPYGWLPYGRLPKHGNRIHREWRISMPETFAHEQEEERLPAHEFHLRGANDCITECRRAFREPDGIFGAITTLVLAEFHLTALEDIIIPEQHAAEVTSRISAARDRLTTIQQHMADLPVDAEEGRAEVEETEAEPHDVLASDAVLEVGVEEGTPVVLAAEGGAAGAAFAPGC